MEKLVQDWLEQAKADKIINSCTQRIKKKIIPCQIILFGSRASGKFRKDSDYDFLLISPQFKQYEWEERSAQIYHLKRGIPAAMDIICLTPQEYDQKKKERGVIQELSKEGVVVSTA